MCSTPNFGNMRSHLWSVSTVHGDFSHLLLSYYHLTPGIVEGERDEATGKFIQPVATDGKETKAIATDDELKSYGRHIPYQQVYHYKAVFDNSFYVGRGNLKAIVAYQQNRREEFEDVLHPNTSGLDFMLHTINYDLHYSLPEQEGWKYAVGLNGMYQRSLNKGDEYLIPAYMMFDIGAFATSSYKWDNWNLSGGLQNRQSSSPQFRTGRSFSKPSPAISQVSQVA